MTAPSAREIRPAADEYAPYYARYVERVPDGDLLEKLRVQGASLVALLEAAEPGAAARRYADGKWSVAQLLGHVCDAERIFAYRILRFARGDTTPLASFDENAYADSDAVEDRGLDDLLDEFRAVRAASIALLRGLSNEAWRRAGTASGVRCTVRGCAWILAGHAAHHEAILRERYLVAAEA
jgi:uncharacterized damage-inducible protein DinB